MERKGLDEMSKMFLWFPDFGDGEDEETVEIDQLRNKSTVGG